MTAHTLSPNAVVIERLFDAPGQLVWEDVDASRALRRLVRPDRRHDSCRQVDAPPLVVHVWYARRCDPHGPMQMWFTGEYREVVEHRRLVYTESMSDEHGNILAPANSGMPEDHPTTTEIAVELDDLRVRTRMVMSPAGSPGATGSNIALDKLAAHLNMHAGAGREVRQGRAGVAPSAVGVGEDRQQSGLHARPLRQRGVAQRAH